MKKFVAVLLLLVLAGLAGAAFHYRARFESDAPQATLSPDSDTLGLAPIQVAVVDRGTGLRSVTATLTAGGTEHKLVAEEYAQPIPEKKFALDLARIPGLKEGAAVLRVTARDASFRNALKGNEATFEKQFTIDVTPPTLELVADDRYVSFGGVGALVYKAGADAATSGVKVGERFFPGFRGVVAGHPDHYFALFAHPYDAPPGAKAVLIATDGAGNTRQMPIAYELKNVKYRKSTIALTDAFLRNKVAPLLADVAARQGSPRDVFVAVNRKLRAENEAKIAQITGKATPSVLWKGAFIQLGNSKVEANFADERTYLLDKQPVDTAYHVGYDLSVTKHTPVEAANSGTVAFTGDLGIYGNTVILDHGLGLYTLYSHLSSIDVKAGDSVAQRQILGKTGETGLAAGDHLHYGVYLDGVAVLPVEWWDAKWIRDNIAPKLEGAEAPRTAQAQPTRAAHRTAHRKRR